MLWLSMHWYNNHFSELSTNKIIVNAQICSTNRFKIGQSGCGECMGLLHVGDHDGVEDDAFVVVMSTGMAMIA